MLKISLLKSVVKDTADSYRKYHKNRIFKANIIFRILQLGMFFLMVMRALNTCNSKTFRFLDFETYIQYGIFAFLKTCFFLQIGYSFISIKINYKLPKH